VYRRRSQPRRPARWLAGPLPINLTIPAELAAAIEHLLTDDAFAGLAPQRTGLRPRIPVGRAARRVHDVYREAIEHRRCIGITRSSAGRAALVAIWAARF
jgi:hypothetical protein